MRDVWTVFEGVNGGGWSMFGQGPVKWYRLPRLKAGDGRKGSIFTNQKSIFWVTSRVFSFFSVQKELLPVIKKASPGFL